MDVHLDAEPHTRPTTARSRELGQELHLARMRANLTATSVAEGLGWSAGKISKMENGWRGTSSWDYGTLLGKLGADHQTRERVRRIASEQDIGHFIRAHDGRLSDNLLCLMIHERAARTLRVYEPMLIPGLLQTEAYARAVIAQYGPLTAEQNEFFVEARLERQQVLCGTRAPDAVFYIHEAALQSAVGDGRVMHDQMMRLAFMCEWKRVRPRVVPLCAPGHAALLHSYNLMTFAKPIRPVAYAENDVSTVFTEEELAIKAYRRKGDVLESLALDAGQSRSVFVHWADVYDRREDRDGPELAQEQLQR
ncbi:helix-turn-helix domain-containing protein [Umezawaea endophytica]|uniref:Helix-turn-helix domain-containing protein n=1 Tax=Umezawaea endophytica TaxID=1654476 RepID=A0A9X3AHJ2_9PSEU|nr:helix-turn-helix transcriptional regulator [Umezawaea endophytica]MCS7481096.1 helix-turn-helix domain-containing protein [Umezawaea endophytica]